MTARAPSRRALVVAALSLLALGALVVCGLYGRQYLDARAQVEQRAAVLAQARQIGVNFVTLDYRTFDRDVEMVLDGATGSFRESFRSGVEQTRTLVEQNESVSTGEVSEAALVTSDDDSATVLLVLDTEVTNTANPQPVARHYRVRLELTRVADQWLANDLQFVG